MNENKERNSTVDLIRGLAVLFMIPANLAGGILVEEKHYYGFRILFTLAAPLFVFIAGFMTGPKQNNFKYILKRAGVILLWGVIIDSLIWKIVPFVNYDVLYLIGISTIILYFIHKLSYDTKYLIGITILLIGGLLFSLEKYLAYGEIIELKSLKEFFERESVIRTVHYLLIDGWFPLLPWFGLFLLGVGYHGSLKHLKTKFYFSIFMFLLGLITWPFLENIFVMRHGYSELFYPPQLPFVLFYGGICGFSGYVIVHNPKLVFPLFGVFIERFGKYSLWIYVLHQFLIEYVFSPLTNTLPFGTVVWQEEKKADLPLYLLCLALLIMICYWSILLLGNLKKRGRNSRYLLFKTLLGF